MIKDDGKTYAQQKGMQLILKLPKLIPIIFKVGKNKTFGNLLKRNIKMQGKDDKLTKAIISFGNSNAAVL